MVVSVLRSNLPFFAPLGFVVSDNAPFFSNYDTDLGSSFDYRLP
jgi:hypothetical protein